MCRYVNLNVVLVRPEECVKSPAAVMSVCWDLNSCPLEERCMLKNAEPSYLPIP